MTKETGIAKATAANQYFLDTCPAVLSYTEKNGTFVFEFDAEIEVPCVPAGIFFDTDQATAAGIAEDVPSFEVQSNV